LLKEVDNDLLTREVSGAGGVTNEFEFCIETGEKIRDQYLEGRSVNSKNNSTSHYNNKVEFSRKETTEGYSENMQNLQKDFIENKSDINTIKFNWKLESNCETNNQIINDGNKIPGNLVLFENQEKNGANDLRFKMFKCELCNFRTFYKGSFWRHQNQHNGKKYKCTNCSHESNDESNLLKHMKTLHFEKTSTCPNCNKVLKNVGARYWHQCQRSYCDQCEMSFAHNKGLKRHIQVKHEGIKKYQCFKCEYKAGQPTHLKTHMRLKHQEAEIIPFPIKA